MKSKRQGGLIQLLIIILIALIILGYYGISVRQAVDNPTSQDNISYVSNGIVYVWDEYLQAPASYLWGIFVNDIWNASINNLERLKNGQSTDIQENGPIVPAVDGNPSPAQPAIPMPGHS